MTTQLLAQCLAKKVDELIHEGMSYEEAWDAVFGEGDYARYHAETATWSAAMDSALANGASWDDAARDADEAMGVRDE